MDYNDIARHLLNPDVHVTSEEKNKIDNIVDTNSQTPTYTEASALETITSGEYLTIAFGKIKKAINSLISHLADTISHITSTERTSWNNKFDKTGGTITGNTEVATADTPRVMARNTTNNNTAIMQASGTLGDYIFGGNTGGSGNLLSYLRIAANKLKYYNGSLETDILHNGMQLINYQITDSNLAVTTGIWYVGPSDPHKPPGVEASQGDGALFVLAYNSQYIAQMYLDWRTYNIYKRYCFGGTWSNWETLYSTSNKPTKSDVGLPLVDNTSDMAKPVSTPQQAALNAVQGNIDNMKIGGRNYLYGSNNQVTMVSPSSGYNQYDWYNSLPEANIVTGVIKYYTLSFIYTPNLSKSMPFSSIVLGNGTDGTSWGTRHWYNGNNVKLYYGTKYIYTCTFAINGTTSATIYNYLKFILEYNNAGCTINWIKLEEGTKATSPCLSQEDMQIKITTPTKYAISLESNWVNYDSSIMGANYYKSIENRVYLGGLIKNGLTANPTLLFTLPPGFRPSLNVVTTAKTTNGTNIALAQINIMTDGSVYLCMNSGYNGWLSLEGISFSTF